jgi:DNA-binding NtrC family response regulator
LPIVGEAEDLYRTGQNAELIRFVNGLPTADDATSQRLLVLRAMAKFDLGDVVDSISDLRTANSSFGSVGASGQFHAAFAHFVREVDFLSPTDAIPHLTRLRQFASQVGDTDSLSSLHLAVARVEGFRGQCLTAHSHLEIARTFAQRSTSTALTCTVDIVEASLQSLAGNLRRSKDLALSCLSRARSASFLKYELAALTNLGVVALYMGQVGKARGLLEQVVPLAAGLTYVRLGATDSLALVALREGRIADCASALRECQVVIGRDRLPARSWYDLAHQVTRCAYLEQLEDWHGMLAVADDAEPELARRQYKAVRTVILCARARALARLGRHHAAAASIAAAVRSCPRGAVDPLIVLEATRGLAAAVKGDRATGALHYDRALAACRAIGHRYHEWWIAAQRDAVVSRPQESVTVETPPGPSLTHTALLVGDVATILGAGHSIDLLAHRVTAILQNTPMAARLEVVNESGHEYRPIPTAEFDAGPDHSHTIRLMGSDRFSSITVRGVETLDELTLFKGLTDLVQMAVARTADTEREDEELTLWPRTPAAEGNDTIFRSPRMIELVRIAERLAATALPVLLTGETGTGKEVFARLIHDRSPRRRGPFVPFNCSAVARDLVESQLFGHRRGAFTGAVDAFPGVVRAAERGTLFLDEIGDLDQAIQPKLLRFLESGEIQPIGDARPQSVGVRIVAATNSNLATLAEQGRFRRDLFYRIGVARIELPPLRERKDEIPALAALFLSKYAAECGRSGLRLGDDFIAALLLFDWPGNIRQLANEVRRAAAMSGDGQTLGAADLSEEVTANWNRRPVVQPRSAAPAVEVRLDQPLTQAIAEVERKFVEHALSASSGRVADAASMLGLSRKGLFLKRRRWGLLGGTRD